MPILSVTRTYADTQTPVQADIDNFVDDIEIATNVTKFDDDNFQNAGIDASTKLIDGSISTSIIRNNNITSAKIANLAVTGEKIADDQITTSLIASAAVTEAKCANGVGEFPAGCVIMLHTYNGTVDIPRGWMLLDGSEVNETNYEAIHGAGTYTADGIGSSFINAKFLPNLDNRYPIGAAATTQSGSGAITAVGNVGHTANLQHSHTYAHDHSIVVGDTIEGDLPSGIQNVLKNGSYVTTSTTPGSSTELSATQNIQPDSIEVMFIMKVV